MIIKDSLEINTDHWFGEAIPANLKGQYLEDEKIEDLLESYLAILENEKTQRRYLIQTKSRIETELFTLEASAKEFIGMDAIGLYRERRK